jgi:hypothetical protein
MTNPLDFARYKASKKPDFEVFNYVYKVWTPCIKADLLPEDFDNKEVFKKKVAAMQDVVVSLAANPVMGAIPPGTYVEVEFADINYLTNPRIVRIGEKIFDISSVAKAPSGNEFKLASYGAPSTVGRRRQGGSNSAKDAPSKSSRAAKGPVTYAPTGEKVDNAKLPNHIRKEIVIHGTKISILKDMETDLRNLIQKYESVFANDPGEKRFLVNNSYRTYEQQNGLYKQNCYDGNYRARTGQGTVGNRKAKCTPLTARPGTSHHGWAAAVDLQSTSMLDTSSKSKKIKTVKYRWLNRYARDYNFIFNVSGEAWHMGWMRVGEFLKGVTYRKNSWSKNGLENGPTAMLLPSKDKPYGTG